MHWRQHIKVSIAQIQRNQVVHTYEAFFSGMDESGAAALKELPEFARVGEYDLLGQEHFIQGYNASNVYCGSDMMYIARTQMELVKGRFPELKGEKETNPFVGLFPERHWRSGLDSTLPGTAPMYISKMTGSCAPDPDALLVHGIRFSSQTDQNGCGHLTAGGIDRFLFSISQQQINISQQSNCFGISDRL